MRRFSVYSFCFSLFAAVLLQGCQSYDIVQTNVFANDDGEVLFVDYGQSEKEHVNTFVSPVNGKELEFKSKLVVRVTMPDGERFTAWRCMNFQSTGTMYKTDSEEWMLLLNGFGCTIYRQSEEDETKYREVFRGVLCDIDKSVKVERNEKWKEVAKPGQTFRREAGNEKKK